MTLGGRETAELLARHGLEPRKALGQNFVVDPNTIDRIVRLSGVKPGDRVVEVGPGLGALTVGLAGAGAAVTAVEIDGALVPILQDRTVGMDVTVIQGDAAKVNWNDLCPEGPWHMVANLPYNVGTPLVLDVLDHVPQVTEFTVMLQREVAERMAAIPGTPEYGIPSVKVAYWATAEVVARIPPSVFLPQPRVESGLLRITRRAQPAVDVPPDLVFRLVRTAFGQRRKMLRKSLSGLVDAAAFERAGVDSAERPEQLGVEAWGALAAASAKQ